MLKAPFGHSKREKQTEKLMANSMGFNKRRSTINGAKAGSLPPTQKIDLQQIKPIIDTRLKVSDLTKPILTKSKKKLLAQNSSKFKIMTNNEKVKDIAEQVKQKNFSKFQQQFENKLGTSVNSIQADNKNLLQENSQNIEIQKQEISLQTQKQISIEKNVKPNLQIIRTDKLNSQSSEQRNPEQYEKQEMYTQTRFFDPDILSFRPLKYPNIMNQQVNPYALQNPNGKVGLYSGAIQGYQNQNSKQVFGQQIMQNSFEQKNLNFNAIHQNMQSNASFGAPQNQINQNLTNINQQITQMNSKNDLNLNTINQQSHQNFMSFQNSRPINQQIQNSSFSSRKQLLNQMNQNNSQSFVHGNQTISPVTGNRSNQENDYLAEMSQAKTFLMQQQGDSLAKKRNTLNAMTQLEQNRSNQYFDQNNQSQRQIVIFDDGKQQFSKIQTQVPFKGSLGAETSYFTKDPSILIGSSEKKKRGSQYINQQTSQKYLQRKRNLYNGEHEVPVFNLKISNQPVLISFKFTVFRLNEKRKIFVSAKLVQGQNQKICQTYVPMPQGNKIGLLLELTEKAIQKYLMMSDNDFGKMIEDLVIVTNGALKIENVNSQQYMVREVMNQGYFAYVDEDEEHKPEEKLLSKIGTMASQISVGKTNYYKNLQIIPKNNKSLFNLSHQLSQATTGAGFLGQQNQLQKSPNMMSVKNSVFLNDKQLNGQKSLEILNDDLENQDYQNNYLQMQNQDHQQNYQQNQLYLPQLQGQMNMQPNYNQQVNFQKQEYFQSMPPINRKEYFQDPSDTGVTRERNESYNYNQASGLSDGFTLMKGISSYGLKNMIKKAKIDEEQYKYNLMSNTTSELSQTHQSAKQNISVTQKNKNEFYKQQRNQINQIFQQPISAVESQNNELSQENYMKNLEQEYNNYQITQNTLPDIGKNIQQRQELNDQNDLQGEYKIESSHALQNNDGNFIDQIYQNDENSLQSMQPPKKFLQTMGNFKIGGLDPNQINTITENFIKNKNGVHLTEKVYTTMNNTRKKNKMSDKNIEIDNQILNNDYDQNSVKQSEQMQLEYQFKNKRPAFHQPILGYDQISEISKQQNQHFNIRNALQIAQTHQNFGLLNIQSPIYLNENQIGNQTQKQYQIENNQFMNGIHTENVSQTNRPNFDQISDATKYVMNQNMQLQSSSSNRINENIYKFNKNNVESQNQTQQKFIKNLYSKNQQDTTYNIIEEEDYQFSSRAKLRKQNIDSISEQQNLNTDQKDKNREVQQFKIQQAEFESRSSSSKTASEGHQPSFLAQSQFQNPFSKQPQFINELNSIQSESKKEEESSEAIFSNPAEGYAELQYQRYQKYLQEQERLRQNNFY